MLVRSAAEKLRAIREDLGSVAVVVVARVSLEREPAADRLETWIVAVAVTISATATAAIVVGLGRR